MDRFPTEIILRIITFLYDVKDKIELSYSNQFMHTLLTTSANCWSPLDLSLHRGNINNTILLNILRTRSIKIVPPWQQKQQLLQQQEKEKSNDNNNNDNKQRHTYINEINLSGCCFISCDALLTVVSTLPFLTTLHLNRYAPISTPETLHYHPRYYKQTKSIMIDMLRDEVYQQRPRHGLSSPNHDLSKQPFVPFILSDTTLKQIFEFTPHLKDLSIQSQHISKQTCEALDQLVPHLCHLDISSCDISISHLQLLLRTIGKRLISLKLLNIDLSKLTLLSLQQYGAKTLECLHLSCIDPQFLPGLTQLVSSLSVLKDFRLTRLRSGNIDHLIHALSTRPFIKYIDISPKLELYPKVLPLSSSPSSSSSTSSIPSSSLPSTSPPKNTSPSNITNNHHQHDFNNSNNNTNSKSIKKNNMSSSSSSSRTGFIRHVDKLKSSKGIINNNNNNINNNNTNDSFTSLSPSSLSSSPSSSSSSPTSSILLFTRAEYDLNISSTSLFKLSQLQFLVELRLCFPTIDAKSLNHFFEITTSPIRLFELRLKENRDDNKKEKYHYYYSQHYQYIDPSYQYKQSLSSSSVENNKNNEEDFLMNLNRLTQLHTLYLYGVPISKKNIEMIMTMKQLQSLVLDHCGKLGHMDPYFLRNWLLSLPRLKMIRMNFIPYLESSVKDLFNLVSSSSSSSSSSRADSESETKQITDNNETNSGGTFHKNNNNNNSNNNSKYNQKLNELEPFYFSDSMFVRSLNGKWDWVD